MEWCIQIIKVTRTDKCTSTSFVVILAEKGIKDCLVAYIYDPGDIREICFVSNNYTIIIYICWFTWSTIGCL
jgi:hypothetical protein